MHTGYEILNQLVYVLTDCALRTQLSHAAEAASQTTTVTELEAPKERRPPWPRQIITSVLPTVKMLSLGGVACRG